MYPNGRCSGYLNSIEIGQCINVFSKGKNTRNPGNYVGIIAYGVGITEVCNKLYDKVKFGSYYSDKNGVYQALPMCVAELNKSDAKCVTLLWASKRMGDKFWLDQIEDLVAEHSAANSRRFVVQFILSRESTATALRGRVNSQILHEVFCKNLLKNIKDDDFQKDEMRFLVVGTKKMIADTHVMLNEIDFDIPGKHSLLCK